MKLHFLSERGFGLLEMVIAMGLLSIVVYSMTKLNVMLMRQVAKSQYRADVETAQAWVRDRFSLADGCQANTKPLPDFGVACAWNPGDPAADQFLPIRDNDNAPLFMKDYTVALNRRGRIRFRAICPDPDGPGPETRQIVFQYRLEKDSGALVPDPMTGLIPPWRNLFKQSWCFFP